jgi:hypothetical protein
MNLGAIESRLLPAVQKAVAGHAVARAGPPVRSTVTGMKFDVWVHAASFQDLGRLTAEGAATARRPVRLGTNLRGFAEERPARIVIEITCTGPTAAGVQTVCGAVPPAVLLALETMPHPELSSLPNESVLLRFADFTAAVSAATTSHCLAGDAGYFEGVVTFQLDGFLHVTLTRRGGVVREPVRPPPALTLRVVQGPNGADVAGEHVLITNSGKEPVQLEGFVLHDSAPQRPHRLVLPARTLAPGASVRVWTGKGKNDADNLYWGRARSVWNDVIDTATLLDRAGTQVARAKYRRQGG